ncbi:MAG: hypothetical protein HYT75_01600, partial [Deltaproteobacteria bacterium]|nr:hypothetical protein [Deltaproteobacteria bacterium]
EIIGQSHKIRVPFFIDEERGEWDDVKLFLREQAVPEFAFVPDAFWPPIGGEQDINMVTIDALSDVPPMQIESSGKPHQNSITIKHLTTFKNPKNTIPDLFEVKVGTDNPEAVGQLEKLLREKIGERVTIQHDDNDVESVTFTIKGEKAHSSMPWAGTLSAVLLFTWAVEDVSYMFTDNPASRALRLVREVGYDSAGAQLFGIDDSPMQNGINTVNIGVLNADRQKVEIGVDVRIRQTLTIENVDTAIEAAAGRAGLKVNPAKAGKLGGIHVPPDSIPLLTALEAYKRWTGDKDAVPQTIGGGTFARAFQAAGAQAVACGLFPPYQRVTDHITNEYVPLHMLQLGALTYLDMLAALAGDPKKLMAIGSAADPLTMSTTTGRMAGFAANRGMMLPFLSNPNLAEKMPPSGELLRHAEESLLTVEQRLAKMAEKK